MSEAGEAFEWAWIDICLRGQNDPENSKPNTGPLLSLLRSDRPISHDVRVLLADLFDPNTKYDVYADVKFSRRGRRSTAHSDIDVFRYCEDWERKNQGSSMGTETWKLVAKVFKKGGVRAAQKACERGRAIVEAGTLGND